MVGIFQFSQNAERNTTLPPNFFRGVEPELIQLGRNTIRLFDQNYPTAPQEIRAQFLELVRISLPQHRELQIWNPEIRRTNIERTRAGLELIGMMVQSHNIDSNGLQFATEIARAGTGTYRYHAGDALALYNNVPSYRGAFLTLIRTMDKVPTTEEIINSTRIQSITHSILEIAGSVFKGPNIFANSEERATFESFLTQIAPLNLQERQRRLAHASNFSRSFGLAGLDHVAREYRTDPNAAPYNLEQLEMRILEVPQQNRTNVFQYSRQIIELDYQIRREREAIGLSNGVFGESRCLEFASILVQNSQTFEQVREEARQLITGFGLDSNNLELTANFAYGIGVLGIERTRELCRTHGMQNFARYTPRTLEAVWQSMHFNQDQRPIYFLFMNRDSQNERGSDWNGSFYLNGPRIETLTIGYRLIIMESPNASDFFTGIIRTAQQYGQIGGWELAGHAGSTVIQTGPNVTNPNHQITITDMNQFQALLARRIFTQNAVGVISGCRTGDTQGNIPPIAQQISRAFGGRPIFAPNVETRTIGFRFDANNLVIGTYYLQGEEMQFIRGQRTDR